jgi:restriction endonuclease S subunit
VCEGITDGDHQPPPKSTSGVPFITITNIDDNHQIDFTKTFFVAYSYYENLSDLRKPRRGDILYTVTGSYGIPALVQSDLHFCFQRHIGLIRPSEKLEPRFLACVLASPFVTIQADKAATGAAQKTVALSSLRNFTVPLPPLDAQRQIVADLEAERKLVEANRELIARMEAKIKAKLAEVWGEDGQACGVQPG